MIGYSRHRIGYSRCLTCDEWFDVYAGDEIEDDCPTCRAKQNTETQESPMTDNPTHPGPWKTVCPGCKASNTLVGVFKKTTYRRMLAMESPTRKGKGTYYYGTFTAGQPSGMPDEKTQHTICTACTWTREGLVSARDVVKPS